MRPKDIYALSLLVAFSIAWALLAIDPLSRSDWVLENLLVWISLPFLVVLHRRLDLSPLSVSLLFVFFLLHAIGGKWSYSNVPFPPWEDWGFERNHYDRIVHFAWGFLLFFPTREAVLRFTPLGTGLAAAFAFTVLTAGSALYEVIEWGAVSMVAPDLGNAFLGAQGDEFDAPKDMGLAMLGALIVAIGMALARVKWTPPRWSPRPYAKPLPHARVPMRPPSQRP